MDREKLAKWLCDRYSIGSHPTWETEDPVSMVLWFGDAAALIAALPQMGAMPTREKIYCAVYGKSGADAVADAVMAVISGAA